MAASASRPSQGYIALVSENGNFGPFFWDLKDREQKEPAPETSSLFNNAASDVATRDFEEPTEGGTSATKGTQAGQRVQMSSL